MPFILGKTIGEIYLERVRATPHTVGFQYKPTYRDAGPVGTWKPVTFREFNSECRLVSFGLMGLGLKPGDRVAIASNTRYEWPLVDMAILGASAVTVPIYASNTAQDMAYILEHSGAKIAVVENARQLEKVLERRDEFKKLEKIIVLDPISMQVAAGLHDVMTLQAVKELGRREEARAPERFENQLRGASPQDLISICYTSGTTGIPKGAMITHDNMVSVLEDCVTVWSKHVRSEAETLVAFLPFSHILGKVESMATYTFGWKECFAENMDTLMSTLHEVRPTLIFSVPRIFEKTFNRIEHSILKGSDARRRLYGWAVDSGRRYFSARWNGEQPGATLAAKYRLAQNLVFRPISQRFGGRLKFAICGGAPLSRDIGEYFEIAGLEILEGYGLTETCAPVAVNTPEHNRFGTVGRPLPEVQIKIADDGEILLKSRKIFKGYYKMPEETAEALRDGWFYTGDIGHLDSDGYLHITDRKKDLIVTSGGKNIAPQKIENLARGLKYLSQLVVHGDRRNYLTALVTLDRDQLIKYANEHSILFSEYAELIRHPKIEGLVQRLIDELNSQLAGYESIKKFMILPKDFSIETGELTPSLKIRRNLINERYKAEFEQMYSS